MATREGIYVGGHEIVERYVGSRLVWEKFKLVLIGSFAYNFTSSSANSNSVEYMMRMDFMVREGMDQPDRKDMKHTAQLL